MQDEAAKSVICATHGRQSLTLVCQHIARGLIEKRRVGFFWPASASPDTRPDAWCSGCDHRVAATGGDWGGDALDQLQPKVLCAACYDMARTFHMGGDPWP